MRPFKGKTNDGKWEESSCSLGTLFAGVINKDFIPETVCRFTEMYDKNKKPIYESDIVRITDPYDNSIIYFISYKPSAFCVNQIGVNFSTYLGEFHNGKYDIEVIGNKFDNPELLKVNYEK